MLKLNLSYLEVRKFDMWNRFFKRNFISDKHLVDVIAAVQCVIDQ
jgi:hypothetical protein